MEKYKIITEFQECYGGIPDCIKDYQKLTLEEINEILKQYLMIYEN